jgi:hypothetical protein
VAPARVQVDFEPSIELAHGYRKADISARARHQDREAPGFENQRRVHAGVLPTHRSGRSGIPGPPPLSAETRHCAALLYAELTGMRFNDAIVRSWTGVAPGAIHERSC